MVLAGCILSLGFTLGARAQCGVYDFYGAVSQNPVWYSCNGASYTLNIQSPNNIGNWTINWGDGSPGQSGTSLVPPNAISHTYAPAVDAYTVVFTETSTGCTVTGTLYMEESTSASIQIPVGGLTQACAPQTMEFINSSTNTSPTTVFTWDFGDGSPDEVYDYTNLGQTISHTYQVGTVDCETVVTLTAENLCNQVQGGPSQASFNPIRIWDIDDAAVTASEVVLCWPENEVTFTNTTERNCLYQGNIYQRYEYWNFGDYWGLGYDSIIPWTPWPPTYPHTIEYPGIGTYSVTLLDSNLCGIDVAVTTITIAPPPEAVADISKDTICEGQSVTLFNNSVNGPGTSYKWWFDDGSGWFHSGAATVDRVFNTAGTYDIVLVSSVGSASGCSDTAMVTLEVIPGPEAIFTPDQNGACDQLDVTFSQSSTGNIISWDWDFGNGNTYTGQSPPVQSYTTPGAYNASLTVESANGCLNSTSQIINVYQSPVADFMAQEICVGSEGTFTDLSTFNPGDPIINWDWDFGDGSNGSQPVEPHTYASAGSYTISLEVSTAHCSADTTRSLNIQSAPVSSFGADVSAGCAALDVNFTNTSTGSVNNTWLFGDGGGSFSEDAQHTYNNFGTVDSVYTVQLIAQTAFGCTDTSSMDITVYPNAKAQFQTFYAPGCSPLPANFQNNSLSAVAYEWNFGDGSPVSTEANPSHVYSHTGVSVGTYTVSLVAFSANGCNDTAFANITVYPEPNFQFELANDSGCAPLEVQFPNVVGAVSYYWTFGDGTISTSAAPAHTFANATLAPVVYPIQLIGTSAFGCTDTATTEVTVFPNPVAQFTTDFNAGCSPFTVSIDNESLIGNTYNWIYGDGMTSDTLADIHTHQFFNATSQTVSYDIGLTATSIYGCGGTYTRQVEVYPEVQADFTHPLEGCSPLSFVMENISVNSDTYQWDMGNGNISVSENPTVAYLNNSGPDSTIFDIRLVATSMFGCEDTAYSSITVYPLPQANFLPNTVAGCSPLEVTFTNNSTLADGYQWFYGEGGSSDTAAVVHNHIFGNSTSGPLETEVYLVASTSFGCTDTTSRELTIYPEVTAAFTSDTAGCSPLNASFVNTSTGASTYFWNFGDGGEAFIDNPTHIFNNTGSNIQSFNTTLIAQSGYGCMDTAYGEISVYPLPHVNFVVGEITGCFPADVEFLNYTTGADSLYWSYGDATTSNSIDSSHSHIYTNGGTDIETYNVVLDAFTDLGCQASHQTTVDIIPQIIAGFNAPEGGCAPLPVEFENTSLGALTYLWNFDDNSGSQVFEPEHIFLNNGTEDSTYTVMLVAQSLWGCSDTAFMDITVYSTPQANFIASPVQQQFPDATVDIANLTIASSTAEYTWQWGDGTESVAQDPDEIPNYTYQTWGNFEIILTVGNELCNDQASQTITIDPPLPIAAFSGEGEGCVPLNVTFTNESEYAVSSSWNFGDGQTSNQFSPTHTYYMPGTYNVALTVTGPGGAQDVEIKTAVVKVHARATAYFTINPPVVNIPDEVFFQNLSENATSYYWDFGDGSNSTEFSPYHTYMEEGWHAVYLVATNEFNCADTFMLDKAVMGKMEGDIKFPNAFTPNPDGASGGYYDISDQFNNNIFFPYYKGVVEYELQIFNRWGELLFETNDLDQGWDGYYRGQLCKQDVYVWKVKAAFIDGGEVFRTGDVTLIR